MHLLHTSVFNPGLIVNMNENYSFSYVDAPSLKLSPYILVI